MKIKLGLGKANMEQIALWCGGELYDFTGEIGCEFEYVCTDSREADEKTMFVATRGERVDGHDYIIKAIELGCRCILCEYVPTNISGKRAAYAVVENSIDAFALCAKGYRAKALPDSIAITGSVGKTTTKEMAAAIMRLSCKTYCTEGNFNSVIGMPMSLMEAEGDCRAAVFEMGMSGFGEIRSMTAAARAKVAMVTNIGSSHLEYLGTRENIAKAKLEIAEGVQYGGYLLLNGDEPLLAKHRSHGYKTLYVGIDNEKCDILASNIVVSEDCTVFDLSFMGKSIKGLKIPLAGRHFVYNASFASSAAMLLGATEDNVREGLASYKAGKMRMNISHKNGITLIADCYNAAPESMRAAIDALSQINVSGRRIAVLGDMKELGKDSESMHVAVGEYAASHGIDFLVTVGELGAKIAEGAEKNGIREAASFVGEDQSRSAAEYIAGNMKTGDAILFKASRSMAFEEIIGLTFKES